MARGAEAKATVTDKILEVFDGAFLYNGGKEIRIPVMDNGELVQIKVTLTCAKENVEVGGDTAVPGAAVSVPKTPVEAPAAKAPDAQEKKNVSDMLARLGL